MPVLSVPAVAHLAEFIYWCFAAFPSAWLMWRYYRLTEDLSDWWLYATTPQIVLLGIYCFIDPTWIVGKLVIMLTVIGIAVLAIHNIWRIVDELVE